MKIEKYMNRLSTHCLINIGDEIYFSALNNNGLYKYNQKTRITSFVGYFPDETMDMRHIHGSGIMINNQLLFAPMNGNSIGIYNTNENRFDSIKIHPEDVGLASKYYFSVLCEDKVFFIPSRASHIIVLDLQNMDVTFVSEWSKWISGSDNNQKSPIIKNGTFLHGKHLYIPLCRHNSILKIETDTYKSSLIDIPVENGGFCDAYYDETDEILWLLQNGKPGVVKTTLEGSSAEVFLAEGIGQQEYPYINLIDMDEFIYLPSYQAAKSVRFSKKNGSFEDAGLDDYRNTDEAEWKVHHYTAKKLSKDCFVTMGTTDYEIRLYDKHGSHTDTWLFLDDDRPARFYKITDYIHREKDKEDLTYFIKSIII